MYKWFLNRGPNCATQNHNTQGRPNGHLRSHPTQSPRARDTHPLDQRSQLTVEPPDGLGGGVIINAEVFRDRVHGNATSAHLSRVRSDPLVHRHRGRPDEVHLDGQPGQGANVFLPGPKIQPKSGVFSHLTSRRERCETPSRAPVRGGPEPHRQPRRVPHRRGIQRVAARLDARSARAAACWTASPTTTTPRRGIMIPVTIRPREALCVAEAPGAAEAW